MLRFGRLVILRPIVAELSIAAFGAGQIQRGLDPQMGKHDLEIGNEMLGYRVTRVVQVPPGKVAPIKIDLPNGVVNLNAAPWAEVFIDGKRVGETPIGNLSVPIGPHEVVFRNPQLGEKRHAISVSLAAPVRVSIDMK